MTTKRCGYAAIVGRPNVGKSTLLNQMVGQKIAITSHKPQTTRHAILGIKTLEQGQIVFVDTPGIHRRGGKGLNRVLNQTAERMLHDVDVILFVVQADVWNEEDEAVLDSVRRSGKPAILVVNKIDLLERRESLLVYLSSFDAADFVEMIPVSSVKYDNVDVVESRVLAHLPENDNFFPEDQITDRTERFMAAELLREQLTRRYAREIPYALTVEIERFESEGERYRIGAVIWVEREGQKRIIIGKKGAALKETARIARESMENCFGKKVWLDVWVKLKKSWSSDEAALSSLGYLDP